MDLSFIDDWLQHINDPIEYCECLFDEITEELEQRVKALEANEVKDGINKVIGDVPYTGPLNARLGAVLDHRLGTDVTIRIGSNPTPYQAHKIVLACSSSYFSELFYGDKANEELSEVSGVFEIFIADLESKNFGLLLQYIYKECLPDVCLSAEEIIDLVKAARMLGITGFMEYFQGFLASFIDKENVTETLDIADLLELPKLQAFCWDYIEARTLSVLENGATDISRSLLFELLDKDFLNASEYKLFRFVHEWAHEQCKRQRIPPTPENLLQVGGPAFQKIRYPTMTALRFTEMVVPTQVLTPAQLLNIYLYINAPSDAKPSSLFNPYPRKIRKSMKDQNLDSKCPARGWKVNPADGQIVFSKQKLIRILSLIDNCREAVTQIVDLFVQFFSGLEEDDLFFD